MKKKKREDIMRKLHIRLDIQQGTVGTAEDFI